MSNINEDGIATPDEGNTLDPEVWSAAMADSISQGIGARLKKQEEKISLRATTPEPFTITAADPSAAYMTIPLTVGGVTNSRAPEPDFAEGNHAEGIEIEGNRAKILTDGLYTLTGQCTFVKVGTPHSWDFYGSINGVPFGLPDYGTTGEAFSGGRTSDTRYLTAGDIIALTCGLGTDHVGSLKVQDALLQITLHYAT
jgi:hypothetical protein